MITLLSHNLYIHPPSLQKSVGGAILEKAITFTHFSRSQNFYFFLFYLYIYPPDSQESDGGANT